MPELWDQFENVSIADTYILRGCLHKAENTAYFLAGGAPGAERAIVRLAAGESAGARFALWRRIAGLSHPNLLRVLDTGWLDWNGPRVAWAALEYPEENLGDVLQDRALTADETRPALIAAAEALAYIHRQGLVHGEMAAWNVVAVGDSIKLTSDGIREPQASQSPAEDVWALGMAACEMLTRRLPEISRGEPQFLPEEARAVEPFREFIGRCLHPEPARRWSAARLAAYLRDPQPAGAPVQAPASVAAPAPAPAPTPAFAPAPKAAKPPLPEPVAQPAPVPEPPAAPKPRAPIPMPVRPAARPSIPRWAWAAAGVAIAAVALLVGMRHSSPPAAAPAAVAQPAPSPASSPAPAPARAVEVARDSAPERESEAPADGAHSWRVIAYTYNSALHAAKKAHNINRRWPHFKAEVFSPRPHQGPYLVALGGPMTREEAVRMQHAARGKGLPRDTFVRNYSH